MTKMTRRRGFLRLITLRCGPCLMLMLAGCSVQQAPPAPAPNPAACRGGVVFMHAEKILEITLWRCAEAAGHPSWLRGELATHEPGYGEILAAVRGLKPEKAVELKIPIPHAVLTAAGRLAAPYQDFAEMVKTGNSRARGL